jgi:hypothetical protein
VISLNHLAVQSSDFYDGIICLHAHEENRADAIEEHSDYFWLGS